MSAAIPDAANGLKVFISYAQDDLDDTDWCNKLEKQLAVLWRQGLITIWSHQKIKFGKEIASETTAYLDAADIILLLISPNYVASDLCYSEMSRAIERHKAGEARVIPVLLSPMADWKQLPFGKLRALPSNGKPIRIWSKSEPALSNVGDGIYSVVKELLNRQDGPRTSYRNTIEEQPPSCPPGTHLQRADLVQKLYSQLTQLEVNAIALTGMAGTGKSTLAALLYHHVEQQRLAGQGHFTEKTLWLEIQDGTTIVDLIGTLREALGKPSLDCGSLTARDMARELFKILNTADKPCLIILNQFERLLDPQTQQALEGRPGIDEWLDMLNSRPCACRVVLTSRFFPRGIHPSPSTYLRKYAVNPLTIDEGIALLHMWGIQAREAELRLAVERCQGYVLVLVILVHMLLDTDSGTRIADFFNDVNYARGRINAMTPLLKRIFTHELNQDQQDLLRAFSIYREAVPLEAAQAIVEDRSEMSIERLMAARQVLLSLYLLQASGHLHYQLHALVAEFAREHFVEDNPQANQQALLSAHARAAQYYQHQTTSNDRSHKRPRRIDDMHNLIEAIWHYCRAGQQQVAYELILQENVFFDLTRWGNNSTLLELYQYLLPSDSWQPAPEQAARIYNEVGEIYQVLGQREKARQYFEQSLQCCRLLDKSVVDTSGGMVNALNNLGSVYRRQGEIEEALKCYQDAERIADKAEEEIIGRGTTLNNIGYAYYELGQRSKSKERGREYYEQALQYYEQALPLHRATRYQGEEARTLNNLGKVYYALKRRNEAYEYYQQALGLAQELGDRWVEAIALNDLGEVADEFEEKLEYYGQAYRIFREIGACEDQITVLKNIGCLHLFREEELRKYDGILACFVLARDIFNELQSSDQGEIPDWVMMELELALGKMQLKELLEEVGKRAEQIVEQALQG